MRAQSRTHISALRCRIGEHRLREIFAQRCDKALLVRAAATVRYGDIVAAIDAAKGAGVTRVGVVTDGMPKSRI